MWPDTLTHPPARVDGKLENARPACVLLPGGALLPGSLPLKPRTRYRLSCETLTDDEGGRNRLTVESRGRVLLERPMATGRGRIAGEFATGADDSAFLSLWRDGGDSLVIDASRWTRSARPLRPARTKLRKPTGPVCCRRGAPWCGRGVLRPAVGLVPARQIPR